MADVRGSVVICDEKCGCPSPCPGGATCRCRSGGEVEHKTCPCGEHCGCNPCTCSKETVPSSGKAACKCQSGCTCVTCSSS
ncbi:hypothetical protein L6452_16011 [Arctium lappa]|uniref:Uncharacterized protein n=1 Tax=Arctium lappa TaxID=4217 RepID=A0ACB9CQ71_ARCLA|nr:hypothetical protein L6452_16011 [Arctium lappa]